MIETKTPELGTSEAAVRSCVSVIAAVTGQPEQIMAYWLDLYFQVRSAHERENAKPKPAEDPTILRRGDLYPVLRELMHDALKSAKHEEAKERLAKRAKQAKAETAKQAAAEPMLPVIADPMALAAAAEKSGERCARAIGAEAAPEGHPDPAGETGDPGEAAEETKLRGWAVKKGLIRTRLLKARQQGATISQIVSASEGTVKDEEILRILNAEKEPMEVYKRIEAALDALQK